MVTAVFKTITIIILLQLVGGIANSGLAFTDGRYQLEDLTAYFDCGELAGFETECYF